MDTRNKILTPERAAALAPEWRRHGAVAVATGHFDVLLAEHVRELRRVFDRPATRVVVLAAPSQPVLEERARAELVAALEMVDYVVPAGAAAEAVLALLPADSVARLEPEDQRRFRGLIQHVHRRQAG